MEDVLIGVEVWAGQDREIFVNNNYISCELAGIALVQNQFATQIEVNNNVIYVDENAFTIDPGYGIAVEESGKDVTNANVTISDNKLYLYGGNWGVFLQSTFHTVVEHNDIFMENVANKAGISVNGSMEPEINCNIIEGSGKTGAAKGIRIFNSEAGL